MTRLVFTWFIGLLVIFIHAPITCGEILRIMNVGDSVSGGAHRLALQSHFSNANFNDYDFVGDIAASGTPTDVNYQACGGALYEHMETGRYVDRGSGAQWEAGVVDAIPRFSPNVFLLLGGYNNMAVENVGGGLSSSLSQFTSLVNYMGAHSPDSYIFISNITDFDPLGSWGDKRQNVLDFNLMISNEVSAWQSQGKNIYLVDNFSDVTYDDLAEDGLHVGASGHAKIGSNWFYAMQDTGLITIPEPSSVALIFYTIGAFLLRRCKTNKYVTSAMKFSNYTDSLNVGKFNRPISTIYTQSWEFEGWQDI